MRAPNVYTLLSFFRLKRKKGVDPSFIMRQIKLWGPPYPVTEAIIPRVAIKSKYRDKELNARIDNDSTLQKTKRTTEAVTQTEYSTGFKSPD